MSCPDVSLPSVGQWSRSGGPVSHLFKVKEYSHRYFGSFV